MVQWPRSQARPGMQQVAAGTARRLALKPGPWHGRCLCPTWSSITGQQSLMKLAPGKGQFQPSQATSSTEKPAGVQKKPGLPLGPLCQLHGAGVSHLVLRHRHLPGRQWQRQSPVREPRRQSHTGGRGCRGFAASTMAGTRASTLGERFTGAALFSLIRTGVLLCPPDEEKWSDLTHIQPPLPPRPQPNCARGLQRPRAWAGLPHITWELEAAL